MEPKTMNKKYFLLCFVDWTTLYLFPMQTTSPDSDYRLAVKAVAENKLPEALNFFELAVTKDPDNARYANDYRQAVIRAKEFDRALKFFEKTVADHPNSANLHLNYGFAHVDKIPAAG